MEIIDATPLDHPEQGATATEYAMLCGFIAMVIVAGVALFGIGLGDYYGHLVTATKSALGLP